MLLLYTCLMLGLMLQQIWQVVHWRMKRKRLCHEVQECRVDFSTTRTSVGWHDNVFRQDKEERNGHQCHPFRSLHYFVLDIGVEKHDQIADEGSIQMCVGNAISHVGVPIDEGSIRFHVNEEGTKQIEEEGEYIEKPHVEEHHAGIHIRRLTPQSRLHIARPLVDCEGEKYCYQRQTAS